MVQQTIPGLFQQQKTEWLDEARATARKLLITRPYITIMDVLAESPRPSYLHKNVTGSVFKHEDFKTCGYQKSTNPSANGRMIFQWTLKEGLPTSKYAFNKRSVEDMSV